MAPLDPLLLAEAREAHAAQAEAQAEAELARVRFATAVRRLHEGGASMREIARAFALSHQRVHQLVDGDRRGARLRCSFCGVDQKAARKLIAGPGVYICERCVTAATAVVEGAAGAARAWAARTADAGARPSRRRQAGDACSFCGKTRAQTARLVAGDGCRICDECLDLCRDIVHEELGGG